MATFLEPIEHIIQVRNQKRKNIPVNLDLVTAIECTTDYWCSDGYWSVNEPVIKFHGVDIIWHFGEDKNKERNKVYDDLLKKFGFNKSKAGFNTIYSVPVVGGMDTDDGKAYLLVESPKQGCDTMMYITTDKKFAERQYESGNYVLHTIQIINP